MPAESPSPDAVPWSAYDLEIGCADALGPPLDPPFLVVTHEDEYLRYFCAASKIDWKKFRLVVYSESGNGEDELFVDDVTRSGSELVVLLSRARQCGERNLSYAVGYVAILIPAGSELVRRLHGASSCR